MSLEVRQADIRSCLAREPVLLALLSGLAVVLFLAVAGLSRIYHRQQESLGNRWFSRGRADLQARHFGVAVAEFHTALIYSRDNYTYQLNLAEALLGLDKTTEAYAYLITLWDRQPENGLVNLDLARIAAREGKIEESLRYYHNAMYATWPGDQEVQRRDTRLELIEFLLHNNAIAQAQAELMALAANLGDDPTQQASLGELFLRAQDYEHALAAFRLSLKTDLHNQAALAGAGLAAFELERYSVAQRYLQAAAAGAPGEPQIVAKLKAADLVLQMDPFRRQISAAQRNQMVLEAFSVAGSRLKSCPGMSTPTTQDAPYQNLQSEWTKLKPRITERGLRQNPDLVNAAMELAFNIERHASGSCGPPKDADTALLLIAKLREGS